MRVYGTSKLCNILFTRELAERAPELHANCFHPGVVRTGFGKNDNGIWKALTTLGAPFFRSPERGARSLVTSCQSRTSRRRLSCGRDWEPSGPPVRSRAPNRAPRASTAELRDTRAWGRAAPWTVRRRRPLHRYDRTALASRIQSSKPRCLGTAARTAEARLRRARLAECRSVVGLERDSYWLLSETPPRGRVPLQGRGMNVFMGYPPTCLVVLASTEAALRRRSAGRAAPDRQGLARGRKRRNM